MTRDFAGPADPDYGREGIYLRRPKSQAVSRRRPGSWLRRWARRSLLAAVWAALWLGLIAVASWYVRSSAYFSLSGAYAVIVTGNHFVSQADIANATGAGAEPNLFRLSLDDVRRQVESIPWVQSASLRRLLPNRLQVHVTERKPVAYVNIAGNLRVVDDEGVILDKPPAATFDFPVLSGIDSAMSAVDRKARLALFERFAQELNSQVNGAGWLVSEVDLSDEGDLKALLVQGHKTILIHFGNRDFGERFATFLALLPQIERTSPAIDSVDLRYRGQVVVDPKSPIDAGQRPKEGGR